MTTATTLNDNQLTDNGSGADDLGTPAATITSFGGATSWHRHRHAAGSSVALAGGTLTVNADGSLTLAYSHHARHLHLRLSTRECRGQCRRHRHHHRSAATNCPRRRFHHGPRPPPSTATCCNRQWQRQPTIWEAPPLPSPASAVAASPASSPTTPPAPAWPSQGAPSPSTPTAASPSPTPTTPGTFTFDYRLANAAGTDDATVTIEVQ